MTPDEKVIREVLHLPGKGEHVAYTAIVVAKAHWVDFWLHEACSWDDSGTLYNSPCHEKHPFGAPLDQSEALFRGFIKWDGCSEGEWCDNQEHVCSGPESYEARFRAVLWMLGEARRLMIAAGGTPDWKAPS